MTANSSVISTSATDMHEDFLVCGVGIDKNVQGISNYYYYY